MGFSFLLGVAAALAGGFPRLLAEAGGDGRTYGRTDGRTDVRTDGRTDGQRDVEVEILF